MKAAQATALVLLGWMSLSPLPASAQLGRLIVTITSPTSGATVSDTIPITANVGIVGALTVARVDFFVNGSFIGSDTSGPPYSADWNTRDAGNGSRTLTAVALGILGIRWSSNPVTVTVDNGTTPPLVTIDQAATQADPTSSAPILFTVVFSEAVTGFTGSDVTITGTAGGAKTVTVSGNGSTYTAAVSGMTTSGTVVATIAAGAATDATGNGNTASTSSDNSVTFNGSSPPMTTRVEDTDAAISYTPADTWTLGHTARPWSGGTAAVASAAGQRATLSFSGTGVSWIGFRGPQAGIAAVYLDGVQVSTVDAYAPEEAIEAALYTVSGLVPGTHTLAIEATGTKNELSTDFFVVVDAFDVSSDEGSSSGNSFAPGDVLVSLETGPVQWRLPNGTLRATLISTVSGTGEGMAFDAAGNLYVSRWCVDSPCTTGNTLEKFNPAGASQGTVGRGYNCDPHTVVFDAVGAAYVGQGGCNRSLLKFAPGALDPIEFALAPDNLGVFWIDLAPDNCTVFYTSYGPNVKRFDVCGNFQLPDFNVAPLPGGEAQDLRVLPDGGVLVSSGQIIARLDAAGALVQRYEVVGESALWAGLDMVGDGTFWAANYESSNVYRFDLASGAVVSSFNTGTPSHTVVGLRVKK